MTRLLVVVDLVGTLWASRTLATSAIVGLMGRRRVIELGRADVVVWMLEWYWSLYGHLKHFRN